MLGLEVRSVHRSWVALWFVLAVVVTPARAILTPGGDHRGTDHTLHDHSGEALAGVDLSPDPVTGVVSVLVSTSFVGSTLDGADLRQVEGGCTGTEPMLVCTSFMNASLVGADLSDARLAASIFDGADLTSATLDGADVSFSSFDGSTLPSATAVGTDVSFSTAVGAMLDGADLTRLDATGTDLSMASAVGATLDSAILTASDWTGADLTGVDLTFADGAAADFATATLAGATLPSARLVASDFTSADLSGGVDASHALLLDDDFTGVDATGAGFRSASLQGSVIVDGVFQGADMTFAELSDVDARCADAVADPPVDPPSIATCTELHGVSMRFARLVDGFFQYALLVEDGGGTPVDLFGADLTRADFSNACMTAVVGGVCEPMPAPPPSPIDLVATEVSGVRFDGAVMVGADLRRSVGECVAARPGDPDGSPRCPSFVGADLRLANLVEARITEGDFATADLTGADLTDATLELAVLDSAVLDGALMVGADLPDASLDFASLVGADLTDAELPSADLTSTDLTGADLTGANLAGVTASSTDFTSAVLTGADLTGATFDLATFAANGTTTVVGGQAQCVLGAGEVAVDLTGAVLVGANLLDAVNFHAGCIVVDSSTTYDSTTTVLPPDFALAGQMTDVPEPAVAIGQATALGVLGLLARRRRRAVSV